MKKGNAQPIYWMVVLLATVMIVGALALVHFDFLSMAGEATDFSSSPLRGSITDLVPGVGQGGSG